MTSAQVGYCSLLFRIDGSHGTRVFVPSKSALGEFSFIQIFDTHVRLLYVRSVNLYGPPSKLRTQDRIAVTSVLQCPSHQKISDLVTSSCPQLRPEEECSRSISEAMHERPSFNTFPPHRLPPASQLFLHSTPIFLPDFLHE